MAAISEGEVAVYDRQLRLWGVQAQQRLLKAKVLVWGLEGSSIEVCKNLVLAGVSVVACDHRDVNSADVRFNYFLREEDVGSSRAECTAKRVQEMNPLCSVLASRLAPEEADRDTLGEAVKGYDFLILSPGVLEWNVDRICKVSTACRDAGIGFALTISCGEIAFFFSDLGSHTVQEHSSAQGGGAGQPEPGDAPELETLHFPSFREWLGCSPAQVQEGGANASFVLVALLLDFLRGRSAPVRPELAAAFQNHCQDVAKCMPAVDGVSDVGDAFRLLFVEPLVHVASVVGGLLAQEVIKFITKRDKPLVNCICFNAHTGAALVERIPAARETKKRKAEVVADILD